MGICFLRGRRCCTGKVGLATVSRIALLARTPSLIFPGIPMVFGWTQDDGALNAGPAHLIQSEADMKAPIRNFASALTEEDFAQLFSLYPVAHFEDRVRDYELEGGPNDPEVSVHFFRLSQILRDMLFTCSFIDFGSSSLSQSQSASADLGSTSIYLYILNQSMLTPLWKGAGMPYIGVSHGSGNPSLSPFLLCYTNIRLI
jgi:hypothetical protein